ncbi:uncharacterized protein LOC124671498 [Lolium rigidum]|uniref:uncharacterized protein LOC124671498 n=1 Tax=Lolium rigidum TaxID=89674 RepID=UPI001F5C3693|nr:uncharacterized protein LOC124671498 [Lolium rigidum]
MVAACSLWAGLSFPSAWAGGLTDPVLSSRVVDFVSIPVDSPLFLPALVWRGCSWDLFSCSFGRRGRRGRLVSLRCLEGLLVGSLRVFVRPARPARPAGFPEMMPSHILSGYQYKPRGIDVYSSRMKYLDSIFCTVATRIRWNFG